MSDERKGRYSWTSGPALANSNVRILDLSSNKLGNDLTPFASAFRKSSELLRYNEISNAGLAFLLSNIGIMNILDISDTNLRFASFETSLRVKDLRIQAIGFVRFDNIDIDFLESIDVRHSIYNGIGTESLTRLLASPNLKSLVIDNGYDGNDYMRRTFLHALSNSSLVSLTYLGGEIRPDS